MRQRLLLFLLFCPLWAFAAADSTAIFQGYSGGMMVHAGYLFGDNPAAALPSGEPLSSQGITAGIGGSIGGGAIHTLAVTQGSQNDWLPEESAVLHKQSFMYINPYAGIDFCLTPRVHLCLRMDWMLAFAQRAILHPTGPRLYVGFMFCH